MQTRTPSRPASGDDNECGCSLLRFIPDIADNVCHDGPAHTDNGLIESPKEPCSIGRNDHVITGGLVDRKQTQMVNSKHLRIHQEPEQVHGECGGSHHPEPVRLEARRSLRSRLTNLPAIEPQMESFDDLSNSDCPHSGWKYVQENN
mmetsp:Transcript_23615/g.65967  ORF Transcript_23615/g.65967 Transcript_23615/m.65967 type:complete len:147 (-) Transcript_23615:77-517(-)